MIALNCLLDLARDDFACHHGMTDGQPTKLCAGYLAARAAPFKVVRDAVAQLAARLSNLPAEDRIRAVFDEWALRVDPDCLMDVYQLGRAWLRDHAAAQDTTDRQTQVPGHDQPKAEK